MVMVMVVVMMMGMGMGTGTGMGMGTGTGTVTVTVTVIFMMIHSIYMTVHFHLPWLKMEGQWLQSWPWQQFDSAALTFIDTSCLHRLVSNLIRGSATTLPFIIYTTHYRHISDSCRCLSAAIRDCGASTRSTGSSWHAS